MNSTDKPRIGWVGLGKLGLPCALVMRKAGFEVCGTDIDRRVSDYIEKGEIPYQEGGVADTFAAGYSIEWKENVESVVSNSDVIFVAVQTPHAPQFEGSTPTPDQRSDFEYGYLITAVREISRVASAAKIVVVVSTVLPGTCDRELGPILSRNSNLSFVYSPAFIAMGTTMADFSEPEMVIAGSSSSKALDVLKLIHSSIHNSPFIELSVIECELVKMFYNTFIGMKVVFGNTIGEVCDKVGGNADKVVSALGCATMRVISSKYMSPGLGDGGGCHPRDQLALSWLAQRLDLSVDVFGWLMRSRDAQTQYIVDLVNHYRAITGLPAFICGSEYKPDTNLTVGSPSRLLMSLFLEPPQWQVDEPDQPGIYVIGVRHSRYLTWLFPMGSVVIDPFGYIPHQRGVTVRAFGRR